VQWRASAGYGNNRGVIGGTSFDDTGAGADRNNLNPFGGLGDGLNLGFLDGTRSVLGANVTMGALVRALESDSDTNVLSTPSLVTLDNQEAEIIVGQNVPFITGSYTTPGNVDNAPFQTIQREDIGLKLKVKPQINQDGTVRLQIAQEVSSISDATVGSDIITNKRSITTTAVVQNHQLVVLGGLIDRSLRSTNSRVPFLGSLPMVGRLFQYRSTSGGKTNLMVFIRPQVLSNADVTARVTGDKYDALRLLQRADAADRDRLAPPAAAPVLPALEEMMRGTQGAPAARQ
jgi:general secretion pathway protein D